ncbi:MAG TPA: translation elongation factor Ts, partial [Spirochaetes bacterium]|nr:translation elongation factor Ts [Spirochaetota bacterium]
TGAGLMECKKALKESSGDSDKAIKLLKEKGTIKAAGKSGRATKEGIICVAIADDMSQGVLVEINCETDFVSRNNDFISACQDITEHVLKTEAQSTSDLPQTIQDEVKGLIIRLGENMGIGQMARMKNTSTGYLSSYIHQGGKIAVLLQTESAKKETHSDPRFLSLTKDISMHIAAMNPTGLSKDDIDPNILKEQKEIFTTQAKDSGKPDNIIEKMVTGRLNQFLKEIVLLEQPFVKDPKLSIQKYTDAESKKLNDSIEIKQFIRFKVGD